MHTIETIEQWLKSCEPVVSETLAGDVLRDVDTVLASRRFNAQVHCTKKSRCRATLVGILLGTSLGLLIGVMLTWVSLDQTGRQIVYVEVPVETTKPEPHNELRPVRERRMDDTVLARAERQVVPMSEIDRLIEATLEQRRQIKLPEGLGGQYVAQHYARHDVSIVPNGGLMMLQRELLEAFQ